MTIQVNLPFVIFSLLEQDLQVLVQKKQLPKGEIQPHTDRDLEAAVKRNLRAITGCVPPYWEQVETVGAQDSANWTVDVIYYSLIAQTQDDSQQWLSVKDALEGELHPSQQGMIKACLQRLHNKSLYTTLPLYLLPEEFTLTECQKVYEAVLEFGLEKKSFRRRLLDAECIKESGNVRRASHRPAMLYQRVSQELIYFQRVIEGPRT